MKCTELAVGLLVIVGQLFLVQVAKCSSVETSDLDETQEESSNSKQQGSWSHWWSYDGISGPDYWNINKRWRLCSLGRKQSPINVRTDRLVYDHLLGPIHLSWLSAGASSLEDAETAPAAAAAAASLDGVVRKEASQATTDEMQKPVKVQLLNSGRGIEVWLEGGAQVQLQSTGKQQQQQQTTAADQNQDDQLILSRGPLSYAYKLFKLELHSAATTNRIDAADQHAHPADDGTADSEEREGVPEALKSGKSSEHLIDGRSFEAELQLHFYNKHLASSAAHAQHQSSEESGPNLFAAISVFLVSASRQKQPPTSTSSMDTSSASGADASRAGQSTKTMASAIDFVLDNLASIQNQGDSIELKLTRGQVESLVPNLHQYITYQGSLNRPPCSESVDWILINKALRVEPEKFQGLFEKLNTNQENIRPIKALNRRLLRTTINNLSGQQQQEQYTKRTRQQADCTSVALSSGGQANKNCSSSRDSSASRSDKWPESGQIGRGSCSMRPNYAYQLRYNNKQF